MTLTGETFSKVVRSLLLDVDVHLDQLEQIGYLAKDQRAFLDKFLYKSEDALRAAAHTQGSLSSESPLVRAAPSKENGASSLTPSPAKSENGVSRVTPHVLPRLRNVTEQLNTEENSLNTFLKRCTDRNFSVKVRGTDLGKEPTTKVKGSEYVVTLEPIAENSMKYGRIEAHETDKKEDRDNLSHGLTRDMSLMQRGASTVLLDIGTEFIDHEATSDGNTTAHLAPGTEENIANADISLHPTDANSSSAKEVGFVTPRSGILSHQDSGDGPESSVEPDSSEDDGHRGKGIAAEDQNEVAKKVVETNTWGKRIKSDPTFNKEGTVVGGQSKPLGEENKGHSIMEKMGWSKGTGLGKQRGGILEPITHVVKNSKAGLATSDDKNRKSFPVPSSLGNMQSPTSDHKAEVDSLNSGKLPESPVVNDSEWDHQVGTSDWENPVKLVTEKVNGGAGTPSTEKHPGELKNGKAQSTGIRAFFLDDPNGSGAKKTIRFNTRIQSTGEYKTTMHSAGIKIRAMSPQGAHYSKRVDDTGLNVWTGNTLEVLRFHQGDEYHVYNFRSRKRGIVKIAHLEMTEEPQGMVAAAFTPPSRSDTTTA